MLIRFTQNLKQTKIDFKMNLDLCAKDNFQRFFCPVISNPLLQLSLHAYLVSYNIACIFMLSTVFSLILTVWFYLALLLTNFFLFLHPWQENENLNKEQPSLLKTSKTETLVVESSVSTHSRNSSYPDASMEVPITAKSSQVQ